jgi:hypothetical protein
MRERIGVFRKEFHELICYPCLSMLGGQQNSPFIRVSLDSDAFRDESQEIVVYDHLLKLFRSVLLRHLCRCEFESLLCRGISRILNRRPIIACAQRFVLIHENRSALFSKGRILLFVLDQKFSYVPPSELILLVFCLSGCL